MKRTGPPRFLVRFFKWYSRSILQESILGDLEEQYLEDIDDFGLARARLRFGWNIFRFMRPGVIRKIEGHQQLNTYGMAKQHFKTTFRIIRREKLYAFINILGLTAGFSIALLTLSYVHFEVNYEAHNPNRDRLIRITTDYLDGETLIDQDCETYHPLGPMIKEQFPEVEEFTRAYRMNAAVVKQGEHNFRVERIFAVDKSFLEMFHYPFIHGNAETAFQGQLEIVLTRSMALKIFGRTDVVGETLWSSTTRTDMKIVGVCEDSPSNTHLKFDMLYPYGMMKETFAKRKSQWNSNDTFTYFLLNQSNQFGQFNESLARLNERLVAEEKIVNERVISQRATDVHLYSHKSFEAEVNGDATTVFFLLGVALLVILIAIVNYINLATAKSLDRAKEVGIRKVLGSSRGQLRLRFFIESLTINMISALLAVAVIFLTIKPFKQLAGLPIDHTLVDNPLFWAVFVVIIFLSSLFGGIFPAYTIASFEPVAVLKGKFTNSSLGVMLRKALVIFQFAMATFLLIQTFTSTRQLDYMQSKDLGLTTDQVLVVKAPATRSEMKNLMPFRDKLLGSPIVNSVALSNCIPGLPTSMMGSTTSVNLIGSPDRHSFNFFVYFFDESFIPTMNMELVAGANFRDGKQEKRVIVNEEAIRLWGIASPEEAIGKKITYAESSTIVGVIKNFHQTGVKSNYIPMIFEHAHNWGNYFSIALNAGEARTQIEEIEEAYKAHFNSPFEFFFLDQKYDAHFQADEQFQTVFGILSLFALLITCLGIFGLASYTVAKRQKEIGIRKVLGASVSQIISLLSKEFTKLILVAILLSIPITYLIISNWLQGYAYHIDIQWMLFAIPALIVILISLATILSRTFQITKTQPVNVLRSE